MLLGDTLEVEVARLDEEREKRRIGAVGSSVPIAKTSVAVSEEELAAAMAEEKQATEAAANDIVVDKKLEVHGVQGQAKKKVKKGKNKKLKTKAV